MNEFNLSKRLVGEFLGTSLLLSIVVGSGIMGERLAGGNIAIALLANSIATGTGLIAIILMLGSISGAHFNPVVSLVESMRGNVPKRELPLYVLVQIAGAFAGVAAAHLMFGSELFSFSTHARTGSAQLFSEFLATFGLIAVIRGVGRSHKSEVPYAVGSYIAAAYWFTSSTSFANPAVTLARAFTSSFAGIELSGVWGFWAAQVIGALAAEFLFRWFEPLPNFKREIGS